MDAPVVGAVVLDVEADDDVVAVVGAGGELDSDVGGDEGGGEVEKDATVLGRNDDKDVRALLGN